MINKPKIVTFTGRPLSGKSLVIKLLLDVRKDFKMFQGKSFTTRPARAGDVPGEYEHVSEETFDQMLARGEFAWTFPHGDYRVATRAQDIDIALLSERVSVMTLVPPALGKLVSHAGSEKIVAFFIGCSEADTFRRLPDRRDEVQKTLGRLRETRGWKNDVLEQGIKVNFISNPNEEEHGLRALNLVLSDLERAGL